MKTLHSWLAAGTLAALTTTAVAEPENYIKYRQAVMKAVGGHMGASTQIVRGKVAEMDTLALHARALADLNADLLRLFPDGSD
ncbi:MAG: cytochrome c, partial [Gammaproteobacteria bacterium]|nr:cytochrome c [Gammaproteobacteria bacterium]